MTRVLVSAASAVVRAGLETIVNTAPDMDAVSAPAGTLVQQVQDMEPDVVLIEVERGGDTLAPLLLSLGGIHGSTPAVLLADDAEGTSTGEALRLGARAILPREAQPEEILAAVRAAASGLIVLHPEGARSLMSALPAITRPEHTVEAENLTPREIEVLGMLAEGTGNKLIARRLGISEHTVKFHVGSILAKLNAASRTEAVAIGVRQGLIML